MVKLLLNRIKPTGGFSYILHLLLVLVLPVAVFVLISLGFVQLVISLIVLSKWRMFAVRPRFWAANIRANAVDLMVGLSIVVFMVHSGSIALKLVWTVAYAIWLLFIKTASSEFMITTQAFIGQLTALMALYLIWASGPVWGLTLLTGIFCFLAARHFLEAFDEPYARLISYIWGYFGAALAWLLSHWLLFYHFISLPTLLLSCLGYGIAVLYYLDHRDKLNTVLKRQFVLGMFAVTLIILVFSDWGDKVV
ncbi:MAG: hypothetical protein ACREHG_07460 [Candidatus Saccharimonadales bacterium]